MWLFHWWDMKTPEATSKFYLRLPFPHLKLNDFLLWFYQRARKADKIASFLCWICLDFCHPILKKNPFTFLSCAEAMSGRWLVSFIKRSWKQQKNQAKRQVLIWGTPFLSHCTSYCYKDNRKSTMEQISSQKTAWLWTPFLREVLRVLNSPPASPLFFHSSFLFPITHFGCRALFAALCTPEWGGCGEMKASPHFILHCTSPVKENF